MIVPTKRLRLSGALFLASYFAAVALVLMVAAYWAFV